MGVQTDLHDLLIQAVEDIGVSLDSSTVPVFKRKLPKVDDQVDTLPAIHIAPSERPGSDQWLDTGREGGARKLRSRWFDVALIRAGNRDPITGQDAFADAGDAIADRLGGSMPVEYPTILNTLFYPNVPYDRKAYQKNYDFRLMRICFLSVEEV